MDPYDDAFLAALEATTLPSARFDHRGHLRAAWAYLRRDGLEAGGPRFEEALRRYAASLGAPEKFDALLTEGWLARVEEGEPTDGEPFPAFLARNPGLLKR